MWQSHLPDNQAVGLLTTGSDFEPQKPSLLCIHGSGGQGREFLPMLELLQGSANCAAIDLPGHGRTPSPGCDQVDGYVAWLADFLAAGPVRPVLLGNSLGGAIALGIALDHPGLISGLVLWGTGARLKVLPKILKGLRDDFQPTVNFLAQMAYADETDAALKEEGRQAMTLSAPEVLHGDYSACDQFDVMERLDEIAIPCLVVCGQGDKLTPVKYSQYLAGHIKGARLEIIAQAGHLIHQEQPQAGATALASFLGSL
jgi:pimeloyl-ACP methyl ester carboxylesterase